MEHYHQSLLIEASPKEVFNYVDNHANFSSHMNRSSWMMGGGSMVTKVDEGNGQKVGSHIQMTGKVFGIEVSLDEVITEHKPPQRKSWKTVGTPKLIIIGDYQMSLEIVPEEVNSSLTVSIDYSLPKSLKTRWIGQLFAGVYAKWCVTQMINGTRDHFATKNISR